MRRESREPFTRQRLQRNLYLAIQAFIKAHASRTCLNACRGGGKKVPGFPGACATRNFTYLARGPRWMANSSRWDNRSTTILCHSFFPLHPLHDHDIHIAYHSTIKSLTLTNHINDDAIVHVESRVHTWSRACVNVTSFANWLWSRQFSPGVFHMELRIKIIWASKDDSDSVPSRNRIFLS